MPIAKATLQRIAALTKTKVEDLEAADKSETEVEVPIDEKLNSFSEPEVNTLKKNSYEDGKKAGVEMDVDSAKKELGLEFQGKTVKGLIEAAQKKALADAKMEPDKKVQELEQKVATLTNTAKEYETKLAEKENEVTGAKVKTELYKHIPALGENGPALGADDILQLAAANGYEFKLEDGKIKPYKGGTLLTDKLGNPMESKDVLTGFMKEKKLVAEDFTPEGRGGKDKTPNPKPMKLSELKKNFEAQGKNVQGQEFAAAVQEASKDADFKMNE